jgi:hypothetical protein
VDDEVPLDGEGNPLDREPFVERVRDQWPLALVLLGVAVGLAVVTVGPFRAGSVIIGGAVVFGAFLRALLPPATAGLLVVRRRTTDVVTLGSLGLALTVVAFLVPPPP